MLLIEVQLTDVEALGLVIDDYLLVQGLDVTRPYQVWDVSSHGRPARLYAQDGMAVETVPDMSRAHL
jgi:hypothetical protein